MPKCVIPAILLATVGAAASAEPSSTDNFRPKDECIHVQGYLELRRSFEDIVRNKDSNALIAMISPDITFEIGGLQGKAPFLKQWQLSLGRASPIWTHLDKVVRLGCFAGSDREVMMPHMINLDPHWSSDRISPKALVLGEHINLRTGPSTNTASKGLISWEFVQIENEIVSAGWTKVKTRDGKSGYIHSDFLRGYLDYRVSFVRTGKIWSINFFAAGD